MEAPGQFARLHIPGPEVTGRPEAGRFLGVGARDDQVFVDGRRRRKTILQIRKFVRDAFAQIDQALHPEAWYRLACLRVERYQKAIVRTKHHLGRQVLRARPEGDPTHARGVRTFILPNFLAGFRFQRNHAVVGGGEIHDAVDHQRSCG